jgi:hypothetical protein
MVGSRLLLNVSKVPPSLFHDLLTGALVVVYLDYRPSAKTSESGIPPT